MRDPEIFLQTDLFSKKKKTCVTFLFILPRTPYRAVRYQQDQLMKSKKNKRTPVPDHDLPSNHLIPRTRSWKPIRIRNLVKRYQKWTALRLVCRHRVFRQIARIPSRRRKWKSKGRHHLRPRRLTGSQPHPIMWHLKLAPEGRQRPPLLLWPVVRLCFCKVRHYFKMNFTFLEI